MAAIVVTQPGATVAVKNGDRVIIDIPGGGDVTVVAANPGVRNFQVDFTDDTLADTLRVDLSTFSKDGLQILVRDYDPTDRVDLMGKTSGGIAPGQLSDYDFTFDGANGAPLSGRVRVLDPGEKDLSTKPPPIIICFAAGTAIATSDGPRAVEDLKPHDLVTTADHGLQPVRWIGQRHLGPDELRTNSHLLPVLIRAGAMGRGLPNADLTVSPQHRIWVSDWRAQLLFGEAEVLVPAKALIDGEGIIPAPVEEVTYHHILFDRHEIVRSNGILSESLHPGEMAMEALGPDIWDAVLGKFPGADRRPTARLVLRYREGLALRSMAA